MSPTNSSKDSPERRRNATLREIMDEMLQHVRDIARRSPEMSADEIEYAQQRLEWLADEVWRAVIDQDRNVGME
jgi:hypothetical protein